MDMLMAVDEVGYAAGLLDESLHLPTQFRSNLLPWQAMQHTVRKDFPQRWKRTLRRQLRHRAERCQAGEGKMQADIESVMQRCQPFRMFMPMAACTHAADCRETSRLGQFDNAAADGLIQGKIIGTKGHSLHNGNRS